MHDFQCQLLPVAVTFKTNYSFNPTCISSSLNLGNLYGIGVLYNKLTSYDGDSDDDDNKSEKKTA